jgi:hypothetical protein
MATGKLKLDEVLLVCDLVRGNVSRAAERLAVTRWALQKFLKRHPRAQAAFAQWRQRLVDEAETQLWDCVSEKQPWAIALVLKTLGKFRGYIEAQHLTPNGQSRLPQGEDGRTDEPWVEALRLPRPPWEDEDAPDDPEPLIDWEAREAELIRCFQAERQTLLARIRELEAVAPVVQPPAGPAPRAPMPAPEPPPPPTPAAEPEADGEDEELRALVSELQRRLKA